MHADDSELDEVRKGGTTGTASFFLGGFQNQRVCEVHVPS